LDFSGGFSPEGPLVSVTTVERVLECFMDSPSPVVDVLRRLAGSASDDVSDAELISRFVNSRDANAFAALVRRHGGLVWGACRRRLRDVHAAEDAFQATFLALARHAGSIRRADALAAWLHRVAVRCSAAFRPPRYHMATPLLDMPARGPDPASAAAALDLERAIDAEIDALPEPFRLAFVLCEVEQRTAADAAKTLGCAVGTVESRLTRARQWLRARLARRGISIGAAIGVAFLSVRRQLRAARLNRHRQLASADDVGDGRRSRARSVLACDHGRRNNWGDGIVGLGGFDLGVVIIAD
jgi:RNA polymerase sigma factor (sigma-70 family)